jgi:hypothetical protein
MLAICTDHLILLGFIVLITLGEEEMYNMTSHKEILFMDTNLPFIKVRVKSPFRA